MGPRVSAAAMLGAAVLVVSAAGLVSFTTAEAQARPGRLEVRGPASADLRQRIERRLAGALTLTAPPTIVGPLGPVGGDAASPPAETLVVRVRLAGRGRRARASIDVATADGIPLVSRSLPNVEGEQARETVASATADAVHDAGIAAEARRAALVRESESRHARAAEAARRAASAPDEARDRAPLQPRLRALSGLALRSRTLDVVLVDGDELVHASGAFAELVLSAEARPFAGSASWSRGVYGELSAAFALGLSAAQQDGGSVGASAFRLLGSVGYRHALGALELGGSAGVGIDTFSLDDNGYAPSTSFPYLRVGPSARLAILPRGLMQARVELGLRLPLGAGQIGDVYGPASALGYDASLGIEGQLGRLAYGLALGLSHVDLSWDPAGAPATIADGDVATEATDVSLHAMATAGYRFF